VSKHIKETLAAKPSSDLLKASYDAGFAEGRIEAIEESMDAVAALIAKAESMIANLSTTADVAIRVNADHTLRALHVAFAAVAGAANGSAAFQSSLEESKQRHLQKTTAVH
jgi:tRNA(Phe) wybutosine-synthesizing methylase Tyw3